MNEVNHASHIRFFPTLFCGEACDAREIAELKRLATPIRFEGGVAFAFPGDFLAMPLADRFSLSADAVGQVGVCRFPREELKRFIESSPNIMRLLIEFAARELQSAQDQLTLLGSGSAEERVAAFLVNWRKRTAPISQAVPLPIRRQDIADFLGLKLETVSRTFAKLEQRDVIRIVPHGVVLTGLEQPS